MEGFRKKQAHAEAVYEQTKSRPTHKTGILGLCGPRVDSIDYYKEEKEKQAGKDKDGGCPTTHSPPVPKGETMVIVIQPFHSRLLAHV